jgi:hypothetical protein
MLVQECHSWRRPNADRPIMPVVKMLLYDLTQTDSFEKCSYIVIESPNYSKPVAVSKHRFNLQ